MFTEASSEVVSMESWPLRNNSLSHLVLCARQDEDPNAGLEQRDDQRKAFHKINLKKPNQNLNMETKN